MLPFFVARGRVEPPTFGLWIQRSNHLSYRAKFDLVTPEKERKLTRRFEFSQTMAEKVETFY